MTAKYISEITDIVIEILVVGNNKLKQRKEPHYCKSWNKLDLACITKSTDYSAAFECEYNITKNKFLEIRKTVRFIKCK